MNLVSHHREAGAVLSLISQQREDEEFRIQEAGDRYTQYYVCVYVKKDKNWTTNRIIRKQKKGGRRGWGKKEVDGGIVGVCKLALTFASHILPNNIYTYIQ